MSDSSTAVATRADGVVSIGERARGLFNAQQKALIKKTVAKDCTDLELEMFLELCARYELDPFLKEIWAAKMGSKNGEGGSVVILVGRDGLLSIAQRSGEYLGMNGEVVREHDSFMKTNKMVEPEHIIRGHALPPLPADKDDPEAPLVFPEGSRGPIVGAWCTVYREGREPTYFYAPMHEYRPKSEAKRTHSPWGSQESAMILKCAESMCLRKAFKITGVVGEDEMRATLSRDAQESAMTEWGEDPTLGVWMPRLFTAANLIREDTYRPAKIRMLLRNRTDEEREQIAADLATWIEENGGKVPARPSLDDVTEDAEVVADEDIEVVQDGEPAEDADEPVAEGDVAFPKTGDPDVRTGDNGDH